MKKFVFILIVFTLLFSPSSFADKVLGSSSTDNADGSTTTRQRVQRSDGTKMSRTIDSKTETNRDGSTTTTKNVTNGDGTKSDSTITKRGMNTTTQKTSTDAKGAKTTSTTSTTSGKNSSTTLKSINHPNGNHTRRISDTTINKDGSKTTNSTTRTQDKNGKTIVRTRYKTEKDSDGDISKTNKTKRSIDRDKRTAREVKTTTIRHKDGKKFTETISDKTYDKDNLPDWAKDLDNFGFSKHPAPKKGMGKKDAEKDAMEWWVIDGLDADALEGWMEDGDEDWFGEEETPEKLKEKWDRDYQEEKKKHRVDDANWGDEDNGPDTSSIAFGGGEPVHTEYHHT